MMPFLLEKQNYYEELTQRASLVSTTQKIAVTISNDNMITSHHKN